MNNKQKTNCIKEFFFPKLTKAFFARLIFLAIFTYLFFSQVIIISKVCGKSMEPTIHDGRIVFCWCLKYKFSEPAVGDIVTVKKMRRKVMFLKRIIALEGDIVEFRDGKLFVNDKEMLEPYVKFSCHWNLPPRTVKKGNVYLIGDNRNMQIEEHVFGQTSIKNLVGVPILL